MKVYEYKPTGYIKGRVVVRLFSLRKCLYAYFQRSWHSGCDVNFHFIPVVSEG